MLKLRSWRASRTPISSVLGHVGQIDAAFSADRTVMKPACRPRSKGFATSNGRSNCDTFDFAKELSVGDHGIILLGITAIVYRISE